MNQTKLAALILKLEDLGVINTVEGISPQEIAKLIIEALEENATK